MPYTKKTAAQSKANILINTVDNIDEITDVNTGSGVDIIATSVGQELEEQYNDLDEIYNGTRITTATGIDLEELGSLVSVNRNQGSKATGFVTFSRNAPTSSDFVLTASRVVATQPNTDNIQFKFLIDTATTFKSAIVDETQKFKDGLYRYKPAQRFIDSISAVDGLVSAVPTTFVQSTDYSITNDFSGEIIDTTNFSLTQDCETPGDWTAGGEADAPTVNSSEFLQGTKSLNLLKAGITSTIMSYSHTLISVIDISSTEVFLNIYILDATQLAKITSIDSYNGSGGGITDSFQVNTLNANLVVGWNRIKIDRLDASTITNGNPDSGNINYLHIVFNLANTTDTFIAGNLLMDFWFRANAESYEGDIIQWDKAQTVPDDNSDFEVDYIPLSVEVPVTADIVGVDSNVSKGKIVFKVTSFSNIDRIYNYKQLTGGVDKESDSSYRLRIQNASQLQSNATSNAIKFNVLAFTFVRSVTIDDTPVTTATAEPHTYLTGVDKYALLKETAIDDALLKIGDSPSATNYTNGVDYILNSDNEIDWSIGGTSPSNLAIYYVDYTYDKLGHFTVFVVGQNGPLTSTQLQQVVDKVEEIRSVGTVPTVTEPTFITVAAEVTLTVNSSFSSTVVAAAVNTALDDYISGTGIGGDVLLAGVINACMQVDGVDNTVVVDIGGGGAADFVIATDEVAVPGTITVNT